MHFLAKIKSCKQPNPDRWLILGDFNMILSAEDKNNSNINRRLMGAFRSTIEELELKEISLIGRKFTWSNNVTHTRIDRFFCTTEWELMLPNCRLYADSSLVSDHCPLILATEGYIRAYRGFRFETFWTEIQGFREEVQQVWSRNLTIQNPFLKLYTKLQRTTKRLRGWAR